MEPMEFINEHPITLNLKELGVTEEQLAAIHFSEFNRGDAFDMWSSRWPADVPTAAIPHIKPFCTLKWLIMENPSYSRDKEDAWRMLAEIEAAPIVKIGRTTKRVQQNRAKNPRAKRYDGGKTLSEIIQELALKPEYQEEGAKEIWPHLCDEMDKLDLEPVEKTSNPPCLEKTIYEYGPKEKRKSISYKYFANIVADARSKKSQ